KVKDDFVTIPFPQVASMDKSSLKAAAAAYQEEKQIVDARLTQRIGLSAKAVAFSDLCRQMRTQTRIEIVADRSVGDDKATVFCKDQPLRDVMRQIAQVFGFQWIRTGEEGAYRYTLIQSFRSQLTEKEMRTHDHHAALAALDDAMASYRSLLDLTPDEVRKK